MKTFKQQITVSDELVQGLAQELGYQSILTRQIEVEVENEWGITKSLQTEEYQNPESPEDFVSRLAKEHTQKFFLPFGEKLVAQAIADAQAQVEVARQQAREQIINPIVNALSTEVITQ